jgi:hypothetical protein
VGQFFDVGPEATGFIAVGQFATGFIAIGQVATGVVAIGQVARGIIVVGQLAVGLVSLGMLSGGLIGSVGMLGAGGRGLGLIVPLVPRLHDIRELPPVVTFDELARGAAREGWIEASFEVSPDQSGRVLVEGVPLPVRIDARLRRALAKHAGRSLLVSLERRGTDFVAVGAMQIPESRIRNPRWWAIWAAQVGVLVVACVFFWLAVIHPLLEGLERVFS